VPRRAGRVARKSKAAEIFYMARKYGVSADEVRKVIKRVGRNRCRVEKAPEAQRRRASAPAVRDARHHQHQRGVATARNGRLPPAKF